MCLFNNLQSVSIRPHLEQDLANLIAADLQQLTLVNDSGRRFSP